MTSTAGVGSQRAGHSEDGRGNGSHESARLRIVPPTSAALRFWAAFDLTSGESSACRDATEDEGWSPS
jgi:hypothetical protein